MELDQLLKQYPPEQTYLLEILSKYQRSKPTQHLTESELKSIAEYLSIPESHIYAVIAFYSFYSLVPRGKYIIQVCRDVPCHVAATFDVVRTLETLLQIPMGATTKDNLFTLEYTSCLGACDGSPAIRINQTIHTHVTPKLLEQLLADCRGGHHA